MLALLVFGSPLFCGGPARLAAPLPTTLLDGPPVASGERDNICQTFWRFWALWPNILLNWTPIVRQSVHSHFPFCCILSSCIFCKLF